MHWLYSAPTYLLRINENPDSYHLSYIHTAYNKDNYTNTNNQKHAVLSKPDHSDGNLSSLKNPHNGQSNCNSAVINTAEDEEEEAEDAEEVVVLLLLLK